jgi:hypothetical protein
LLNAAECCASDNRQKRGTIKWQRWETERQGAHRSDIGSGALVYKGAHGNNPQVSIWEVTLYGTLKMATEDNKDFTSKFGVTKTVQECAEKRMKRRTIIRAT